MGVTEDPKALMWRITEEIWNKSRLELIDELIAEDLVNHVELDGLEGEYWEIPATGRSFDVPTFGILRFANGQAVERRGMSDNLGIMQQLGLMD